MYDKELSLAQHLAVEAGKEIMTFFKKEYTITEKHDYDHDSQSTSADLAANELIVNGLKKEFPYHILAEETVDNPSRLNHTIIWIVDPLDGTKQFIAGDSGFTVNIALVEHGRPVVGVIYSPVTDELFSAARGSGAFHTAHKITKQIHVSSKTNFKDMIIVESKNHSNLHIMAALEPLFASSQKVGSSLKGCLVAEGSADIYFRFGPTSEWDICAMHCIVEEAGGRITSMDGTEITYNRENVRNKPFLASNGKVHEKLLALAKPYL